MVVAELLWSKKFDVRYEDDEHVIPENAGQAFIHDHRPYLPRNTQEATPLSELNRRQTSVAKIMCVRGPT